MKRVYVAVAFLVTSLSLTFIISCKRNQDVYGNPRLQVRLVDSPGDYEAVYIDVKDILINLTGDTLNGWQSLAGVNTGTYDLLKLVNDRDTILANAEISSGRLHQIRLVLGTENYVKIEGTSQLIKLETPSAQQSGLKLNVQMDIQDGILYKITLDFDAARSIVKTGNNKYMLKPVIRTILNSVGGSLKGVVMPKTFPTVVYAVNGTDTVASTYTATNGGYLIKGLPAGTYKVYYNPSDINYYDSLRNNIAVQFNQVTKVDTTFLRHK
jgi:hypothetical protein